MGNGLNSSFFLVCFFISLFFAHFGDGLGEDQTKEWQKNRRLGCRWDDHQHKTVCGMPPPGPHKTNEGASDEGGRGPAGGHANAGTAGGNKAASVLDYAHNRFDFKKDRPSPEVPTCRPPYK